MEELLSYRLSDLLLFSDQTYLRQFQRFNQWLYPLQFLTLIYGLAFLPAWWKGHLQLTRGMAAITAVLWLICLHAFMYRFYAQINWMVLYLIVPMALQPLLLAVAATQRAMPAKPTYSALLIWLSALLMPAADGFVMWEPSVVVPYPTSSTIGVAPRASAVSRSSISTTPAPSEQTTPSRSVSKGLGVRSGVSLNRVEAAMSLSNTPAVRKCSSSAPPQIIARA